MSSTSRHETYQAKLLACKVKSTPSQLLTLIRDAKLIAHPSVHLSHRLEGSSRTRNSIPRLCDTFSLSFTKAGVEGKEEGLGS